MSLQPEPARNPVERSPAPWPLRMEMYLIFIKLKELPKGTYDPLEAKLAGEQYGKFEGGLGAVTIFRYLDTPVGPYDELAIIPGNFNVPQPTDKSIKLPKSARRVARIYVSQRSTMYNGRLNWNVPKHLARFKISAPPTLKGQSPPKSVTVEVFPPDTIQDDGAPPFFACTLTPWRWVPAIPVSLSYFPTLPAAQPPLPEPAGRETALDFELEAGPIDNYDINPKHEESLLVGTERWCMFEFKGRVPRARGCWVQLHDMAGKGGVGSDEWFPQGLKPWTSVGGWMEEAKLDITAPVEWKVDDAVVQAGMP